jgi:hypothetical protein
MDYPETAWFAEVIPNHWRSPRRLLAKQIYGKDAKLTEWPRLASRVVPGLDITGYLGQLTDLSRIWREAKRGS